MKLKNKKVFITGASRGIGRAIALLFAQEGADVAVHCHRRDKEEEDLLQQIQSFQGKEALCVEADVSNLKEVEKMIMKVHKSLGSIDILVNNAGMYRNTPYFEETQKDFDSLMSINLRSAYFCSQHVAKLMQKKKSGNIINIASVAGLYPRKGSFLYAVTKAGLIHLSSSLALTLAPHIRVNAIAPSYTKTDFMPFMKDKKMLQKKKKLIPLGRFNEPEDVAKAALFLASEDSRNITGQVLVIDGGRGANIL